MRRLWFGLLLVLLGCGGEAVAPTATAVVAPFDLAAGFVAKLLPYTFQQPTQFFVADGALWVAQLNGGESEGVGQVLRVDLASGEQAVVLDNLDKPTGIALLDGALWVATRDALLRADPAEPNSATAVLTDLPNNGRSNGTLTVTPDGLLLYVTSGTRRDASSGRLWLLDPQTGASRELARGLKNGYAHVFDENGRLWITEIGDGKIADQPIPDEINWVEPGADFGWPHCYGRELAGLDCDGVRPAVATFPVGSTPTAIAASPFAPNTLLVALWLTGEVVALPLTFGGDNATGEIRPFISQMQNPQHLISHEDEVWVSEYRTGRIWVIRENEKRG